MLEDFSAKEINTENQHGATLKPGAPLSAATWKSASKSCTAFVAFINY
jgi:hypothetical protein